MDPGKEKDMMISNRSFGKKNNEQHLAMLMKHHGDGLHFVRSIKVCVLRLDLFIDMPEII